MTIPSKVFYFVTYVIKYFLINQLLVSATSGACINALVHVIMYHYNDKNDSCF